jgi:hypothetical protein
VRVTAICAWAVPSVTEGVAELNWSVPCGPLGASLSTMVSTAVAVPSVAPPSGALSTSCTVSLDSAAASFEIGTVKFLLASSPAPQLSVPLALVKSLPAVAVCALVA